MTDIAELNTRFGIPAALTFGEYGGVGIAEVTAAHGKATIALQGAQVIAWAPDGEKPVIWLSSDAQFVPGKSVRGGVPVCWPWFGAHASESGYPAHGYARTVPWQVTRAGPMIDGRVRLAFELIENDITRRLWPHTSPVELHITVGNTLELELVTRNAGKKPLTISEALHTYFAVGDVRKVRIQGLDGAEYLDKVGAMQRRKQIGPVLFTGETDRIYLDTDAKCVIDDGEWQRRIHIAKTGSHSTVVWNPWAVKAQKMGDMGEDGHLDMVCVESGNAADNAVTLAPGAEHRLSVTYRVEK
jgi:glucose-6-phosphate 1-epimerase